MATVKYIRYDQDLAKSKSLGWRPWAGLDGLVLAIVAVCFITLVNGNGKEPPRQAPQEAHQQQKTSWRRRLSSSIPSAGVVFLFCFGKAHLEGGVETRIHQGRCAADPAVRCQLGGGSVQADARPVCGEGCKNKLLYKNIHEFFVDFKEEQQSNQFLQKGNNKTIKTNTKNRRRNCRIRWTGTVGCQSRRMTEHGLVAATRRFSLGSNLRPAEREALCKGEAAAGIETEAERRLCGTKPSREEIEAARRERRE
ncbi:hypothetical protein ABZP36_003700 [Zizania latifolia]